MQNLERFENELIAYLSNIEAEIYERCVHVCVCSRCSGVWMIVDLWATADVLTPDLTRSLICDYNGTRLCEHTHTRSMLSRFDPSRVTEVAASGVGFAGSGLRPFVSRGTQQR